MATRSQSKPKISKEQIIEEAFGLLRETNLAGLTMRVLADRLGIKAASLYWHFPNKAALEAAMSERLFIKNTLEVPDAANLKDWMAGAGRHLYRNLMDCPDSTALMRKAELSPEQFSNTMRIVRSNMAKFDEDLERALGLYAGVEAIINGWVAVAQSPYGPGLAATFNIEETAFATLDALIEGWDMTPRN